ncbi:MAG: hypothetical protein AAGF72_05565 [Pseudomonadota bacterium]
MATEDCIETAPTNSCARRGFTVFIDPPDCDWYRSTDGLLLNLQSWVQVIAQIDPNEASKDELRNALSATASSLALTMDTLTSRIGEAPNEVVNLIRDYLASDEYAEGGK